MHILRCLRCTEGDRQWRVIQSWNCRETVILVPSSLSLFKICLEANTLFSLFAFLIFY